MSNRVEGAPRSGLDQVIAMLDEHDRRSAAFGVLRRQEVQPCTPGYLSEVALPIADQVSAALPSDESAVGKVANSLFSISDFDRNFRQDLCAGRITTATAKTGLKVIAKACTAVIAVQAGLLTAGLGLVAGGPGGVVAGLGVGAAILWGGTYAVGKLVDAVAGAGSDALTRTRDYVRKLRGES